MRKRYSGPSRNLPEGCIIENDICTDKGIVICAGMTTIDEHVKEMIVRQIPYVSVGLITSDEEKTIKVDGVEKDDSIQFSDTFKQYAVEGLQSIYNNIDNPNEITEGVEKLSAYMCEYVNDSTELGINLSKLKVSDEYTYKHSVDVGTISAVIAASMGKSLDFIHDIAIAGVLHDLGKEKIPLEILNKNARLTPDEFNVIKKHPIYSYQIMREATGIPEEIRQAMLNHHENVDGTGYPRGLHGEEIGDMGKIIAVADVFDALVTARPYKEAKTPAQAIEIMFTMNNKFDITVFRQFLNIINAYPNGTTVKLSNGQEAVVVSQNKAYPMRPIVKIIETGEVIDLATDGHYLSVVIIN